MVAALYPDPPFHRVRRLPHRTRRGAAVVPADPVPGPQPRSFFRTCTFAGARNALLLTPFPYSPQNLHVDTRSRRIADPRIRHDLDDRTVGALRLLRHGRDSR